MVVKAVAANSAGLSIKDRITQLLTASSACDNKLFECIVLIESKLIERITATNGAGKYKQVHHPELTGAVDYNPHVEPKRAKSPKRGRE